MSLPNSELRPADAELAGLTDGYCNETLAEPELRRLEERLRGDRAAQRYFVAYLDVHARLCRPFAGASKRATEPVRSTPAMRRIRPWWAAAAAVAAMTSAAVLLPRLLPTGDSDRKGSEAGQSTVPAPAARLTRVLAARWGGTNATLAAGDALLPGRLELTQGLVEITFGGGAVVLLESPAQLEILGPDKAFLHAGRAVARVPPPAIGFVLDTARAHFVDLGTEFGVGVDPAGETVLQVFEGVVVAEPKGGGKGGLSERLTAGQARRLEVSDAGGGPRLGPVDFAAARFVRTFPAYPDRRGPQTPFNVSTLAEVRIDPAPRGGPVIDGDLSDWDAARFLRSACIEPYRENHYLEAAMRYDDRCLYLAAHVGDPEPMLSVVDTAADPRYFWAGGSVLVRLTTNRASKWPLDAKGPGLRETAGNPLRPQDVDGQIVHIGMWHSRAAGKARLYLAYGMDEHGILFDPPGWRGVVRRDPDGRGYTLEYAIPWSLLNAGADPPRAGDRTACSWTVHWSDSGGRICTGQLVEVTNPAAKPYLFLRAETWGRAVYEPRNGELRHGAK